jgi:hypothetical protein
MIAWAELPQIDDLVRAGVLAFAADYSHKCNILPITRWNVSRGPAKGKVMPKGKHPWWGWCLLFILIGLVVWRLLPDRPKPPITQEQARQASEAIESEAADLCAGIPENLMRACTESMKAPWRNRADRQRVGER